MSSVVYSHDFTDSKPLYNNDELFNCPTKEEVKAGAEEEKQEEGEEEANGSIVDEEDEVDEEDGEENGVIGDNDNGATSTTSINFVISEPTCGICSKKKTNGET